MVTLVYEYSKPKEFNGFVCKIDQVSFEDFDEFKKYLNGEAAYDFLDNSVKKNDDEKLLTFSISSSALCKLFFLSKNLLLTSSLSIA